jgi:hypothetical protein
MDLKNAKVIVINGIQRGGTNVIWNILQSHPQVCSPLRETGRILHESRPVDLLWRYFLMRLPSPLMVSTLGSWADKRFFDNKMKVLFHQEDRFKYEDTIYSEEEIQKCVLCIKSVNEDILLTEFFSKIYTECYFIGVVRNGYAVCDSWLRRGRSVKEAAYYYSTYVDKMINDSYKYENYKLVKLEDALRKPFEVATELYTFAQLYPERLEKIRLKSKRIFNVAGIHQPRFGEEKRKYWFSEKTIADILDPNISQVQAENLSVNDKLQFEKDTKTILRLLNYA